MAAADKVVFLLDCDDTLLDNDRVIDDLRAHLARALDPHSLTAYPPADLALARIGDLLNYDSPVWSGPARAAGGEQETT